MLHLYPCYEGKPFDGPSSPYHRLHGDMDADELFAFLMALWDYGEPANAPNRPTSPKQVISRLLKGDRQILSGGLMAVSGTFTLFPSCCCGLEAWQDWRGIKQGAYGPWLGHDPDPYVDTAGAQAILYTDTRPNSNALEVSYQELSEAVETAGQTFSQFLGTLTAWLHEVDPANAKRLSGKISQWFSVDLPKA